jgi:hypothetical protein
MTGIANNNDDITEISRKLRAQGVGEGIEFVLCTLPSNARFIVIGNRVWGLTPYNRLRRTSLRASLATQLATEMTRYRTATG